VRGTAVSVGVIVALAAGVKVGPIGVSVDAIVDVSDGIEVGVANRARSQASKIGKINNISPEVKASFRKSRREIQEICECNPMFSLPGINGLPFGYCKHHTWIGTNGSLTDQHIWNYLLNVHETIIELTISFYDNTVYEG
jgi:hypothetical protein